jgi:hypothetical protein
MVEKNSSSYLNSLSVAIVDFTKSSFYYVSFFSVALRPNAGHGLLILEVSSSHTTTHHSR